jgi:TonB family protein
MQLYIDFLSHPETGEILGSLAFATMLWSLVAGGVLLLLRFAVSMPALLKYHLSSATLLALPLGLLLTPLLDLGGLWPSGSAFGSGLNAILGNNAITLPEIIVQFGAESSDTTSFWSSISFSALLISLLLLTPVAGFGRLAWMYIQTRRELSGTKPLHAENAQHQAILNAMERLRGMYRIRRKVRLQRADEASTPFTLGWRRPVIVLPEACLHAETEKLDLILAHELVHISRADYALHFSELLIRHLFWLHPFVHLLYKQAAWQREVSCDAEVLRQPDADPSHYARLLYDFALSSARKPAFRAAMSQEPGLLRRIRQMQKMHKHNSSNPQTNTTLMKKSIYTSMAFLLLLSGLMACSDLTQNPDADAPAEVELEGQTYTTAELREMLTDMRANFAENLENDSEKDSEYFRNAMREQIETVDQLIMLLDNNEPQRVVAGLEKMMQNTPPPPPPPNLDDDVFMVVEEMPKIKGGQRALYDGIKYPEMALRAGLEGRSIIQFVVNERGDVENPRVVRSAGGGGLDEAAVEAISMLEFEPGLQNGEPVKVMMTQPVVFRLPSDEN